MRNLPNEIINYIFDFNRIYIPIINKEDLKFKKIIFNNKINIIKKWYKKYKIIKNIPIFFLNNFYNNNYEKWYLIRIFMKFYPKDDLLIWPFYLIKKYKLKEYYNIDKFTAFQVFNFMKNQSLENIARGSHFSLKRFVGKFF